SRASTPASPGGVSTAPLRQSSCKVGSTGGAAQAGVSGDSRAIHPPRVDPLRLHPLYLHPFREPPEGRGDDQASCVTSTTVGPIRTEPPAESSGTGPKAAGSLARRLPGHRFAGRLQL